MTVVLKEWAGWQSGSMYVDSSEAAVRVLIMLAKASVALSWLFMRRRQARRNRRMRKWRRRGSKISSSHERGGTMP